MKVDTFILKLEKKEFVIYLASFNVIKLNTMFLNSDN